MLPLSSSLSVTTKVTGSDPTLCWYFFSYGRHSPCHCPSRCLRSMPMASVVPQYIALRNKRKTDAEHNSKRRRKALREFFDLGMLQVDIKKESWETHCNEHCLGTQTLLVPAQLEFWILEAIFAGEFAQLQTRGMFFCFIGAKLRRFVGRTEILST